MTTKNKGRTAGNDATQNTDHGFDSTPTAKNIGKAPYGPDFVQISAAEAMRRMCDGVPGAIITCVQHDAWCKTLRTGHGSDCSCTPDQSYWLCDRSDA